MKFMQSGLQYGQLFQMSESKIFHTSEHLKKH